jgi:hypothetical protein
MSNPIAAALVEAWESGNPVTPTPIADMAAAEDIAAAVLEALGALPCGLRMTETGLVGPMLESRFMTTGMALSAAMLRHAQVAPALVGVLAQELADGPPVFARLHPALDISSTRWRDDAATPAEATADLARLGHVVLGKGKVAPLPTACALLAGEARARAKPAAAEALLLRAAQAAREMGGLPAGAVLVAVLDGRGAPALAGGWAASWPGLGRAAARITGPD